MNFITLGGVAVNLDRITFIDFRKEGQATIHACGSTFQFEGADAGALLKRFPPKAAKPEPVAKADPAEK